METESLRPSNSSGLETVVKRTSRLITIEPVIILYGLFQSWTQGLYPVSLFDNKIERENIINTSHLELPCHEPNATDFLEADRIQSEASNFALYLNLALVIPGLFSTVILSSLSETRGRKFMMSIPLIGAFLRMLIFLLVSVFNWPIAVLLLGSLIDGICGMSSTMLMLCYTYLTDITALQQRSLRLALLSFLSSIATVISEISVGYCIKYLGYVWTFLILISILAVNFLYVILILPESFAVGQPLQIQCCRPTDTRAYLSSLWRPFIRMLNLYMKDDGSGRRWKLRFTCVLLLLVGSIQLGQSPIHTLFMLAYPLCFTSVLIGYYNCCSYLVTNITSVVAIKLFVARIGDLGLIFVGCLFGISFQLVYGFSFNKISVFLGRCMSSYS